MENEEEIEENNKLEKEDIGKGNTQMSESQKKYKDRAQVYNPVTGRWVKN